METHSLGVRYCPWNMSSTVPVTWNTWLCIYMHKQSKDDSTSSVLDI